MMRSMYSAVSGLKTHQTKMDVIGNNIANVNTVAFKSSSVTFQDILYQTTAGASGANVASGLGGVNAKQIGLGVAMAATNVSIETAGATEVTGNPFDIKLTDKNSTNFFIVNDGSSNLFTRTGSFYIDGAGNLAMSSTGYTVMGWQVDPTTGDIRKENVSALRIMQEKNLTSAPEATTNAVMAGVLDENDVDVRSDAGKVINLNFYDSLGYQYVAKFAVKNTDVAGEYSVELTSIINSDNKDLVKGYDAARMSTLFGSSQLTERITDTLNQDALDTGYVLNADGSITYSRNDVYAVTTTTDYTVQIDGVTYTYDAVNRDFYDTDRNALKNVLANNPANNGYTYDPETHAFYCKYTNASNTEVEVTSATPITETVVKVNGKEYQLDGNNDFISEDNENLNTVIPNFTYDAVAKTVTYTEKIEYTYNETNNTFEGDNTPQTVKSLKDMFGVSDVKLEALKNDPDYSITFDKQAGAYLITEQAATFTLKFNTTDGSFNSIDNDNSVFLKLGDAIGAGNMNEEGNFKNISIDFSQCLNYNNSGKSTLSMDPGGLDGSTGKGKKLGNMIGVSVDGSGKIFGSYDNGNTELLGQIAVAQFSNASGLEKIGESCYQSTLNSGDFDGIGVEVDADGSSMTTGELEMSNVDLSQEFTQMITTQRGFQANSRVITTSDTLLEELVNLKR